MVISHTDLDKIKSLVDERKRLLRAKEAVDKNTKVETYNSQLIDPENPHSSYGSNILLCMNMSRGEVLHHITSRLYQVELAIKTYGVEV